MHGEVQQHPQKGLPSGAVQVQDGALLAAAKYALGLSDRERQRESSIMREAESQLDLDF